MHAPAQPWNLYQKIRDPSEKLQRIATLKSKDFDNKENSEKFPKLLEILNKTMIKTTQNGKYTDKPSRLNAYFETG